MTAGKECFVSPGWIGTERNGKRPKDRERAGVSDDANGVWQRLWPGVRAQSKLHHRRGALIWPHKRSCVAPLHDTCCWGTGAFGGIRMFTGATGYRWCDTIRLWRGSIITICVIPTFFGYQSLRKCRCSWDYYVSRFVVNPFLLVIYKFTPYRHGAPVACAGASRFT